MVTLPAERAGAAKTEIIKIADAPISKVTVYKSDRAEVTRQVHFEPDEPGIYELKVRGLPHTTESDSVRLEGTGHCTILHVSYAEEHIEPDDDADAKATSDVAAQVKQLEETIQDLTDRLAAAASHHRRSEALQSLVCQYAGVVVGGAGAAGANAAAGAPGTASSAGNAAAPAPPPPLDAFDAVLAYTRKHLEGADDERAGIEKERRALNAELTSAQERLNKLRFAVAPRGGGGAALVRQIVVSLDVTEAGAVDLVARYVTRGARWTSSYDVRVATAHNAISCVYYGEVVQGTGEDWDDVRLTLSTAEPAISGTPPALEPKTVRWRAPPRRPLGAMMMMKTRGRHAAAMDMAPGAETYGWSPTTPAFAAAPLPPPPPAPVATAAVDSGGALGAVAYEIAAPASVTSDFMAKKLTVGILELSADVTHYVVPALEAAAYLKAKVLNTTDYLLLASDDVSIFFDNRFVTKTSLRTVSPGEGFDVFLGVDPAVKVSYAPPRKTTRRRGLLSKTQLVTHAHCTTLNNAKAVPITVALVDAVPRSSEDLIKVLLKDPAPNTVTDVSVDANEALVSAALELLEGEGGGGGSSAAAAVAAAGTLRVVQNESGKLVWIVRVPPHTDARVPFEYSIEWPADKNIEVD